MWYSVQGFKLNGVYPILPLQLGIKRPLQRIMQPVDSVVRHRHQLRREHRSHACRRVHEVARVRPTAPYTASSSGS